MNRWLKVLVTAAGVLAFAAPGASASGLHCGKLLKHDVKLTKNLNCSHSGTDGLRIGAAGVSVDLNGHKLIGPRSDGIGINDTRGGWDKLTVKNGTISGFSYGLDTQRASKVHVSDVEIELKGSNDDYGASIDHGSGLHVSSVRVDNALTGFALFTVRGLKFKKLTVTGSDPDATYGIYEQNGTGVIDGLKANEAEYGAYVTGYSNGMTVRDSTTNRVGYAGVYVSQLASTDPYTVRGCTANDAGSYGFYADFATTKGGDNKATGAGIENFHNVPH